jgi:hypothetical protein
MQAGGQVLLPDLPCPDDADTDLFLCHPCTEAGRSMRLQSAAAGGMLAA